MFDDRIARCCGYDAGSCGDVKGVFVVATGSDDIDSIELREIDRYTHFEQRFPESGQFVEGDAAHQEHGDKGGDLTVVVLAVCHADQHVTGLIPVEIAVFEESV